MNETIKSLLDAGLAQSILEAAEADAEHKRAEAEREANHRKAVTQIMEQMGVPSFEFDEQGRIALDDEFALLPHPGMFNTINFFITGLDSDPDDSPTKFITAFDLDRPIAMQTKPTQFWRVAAERISEFREWRALVAKSAELSAAHPKPELPHWGLNAIYMMRALIDSVQAYGVMNQSAERVRILGDLAAMYSSEAID